jgi:hypothetical protein
LPCRRRGRMQKKLKRLLSIEVKVLVLLVDGRQARL